MLKLVFASVRYYWRTTFAVILALTISTAVIGGSLIVGDSVRTSLQQMSLQRLGGIQHAMASHRFFREELASEITAELRSGSGSEAASGSEAVEGAASSDQLEIVPALLLTGAVEKTTENSATALPGNTRRVGSSTILVSPRGLETA